MCELEGPLALSGSSLPCEMAMKRRHTRSAAGAADAGAGDSSASDRRVRSRSRAQAAQQAQRAARQRAEQAAEDSEEHEVREVIDHRHAASGKREYLVSWEGFPNEEDDTWEPEENIRGAEEMVQSYLRRHGETTARDARRKTAQDDGAPRSRRGAASARHRHGRGTSASAGPFIRARALARGAQRVSVGAPLQLRTSLTSNAVRLSDSQSTARGNKTPPTRNVARG